MSAIEPDPNRPDLDELIHVGEAHEQLMREAAAAAREKPLGGASLGPVPLWFVCVFGLLAVIAGGVLGASGRLFAFDQLGRPGYVRAVPEGAVVAGPQPMPALVAFSRRGQTVYTTRCIACHGPNGQGDGANFPSLVGSQWVVGPTQKLAMIILNGLEGATSTSKAYAGPMAPQGGGMSPEDLAAVMTFVRNELGNDVGQVVSLAQAQAAFEVSAARTRAPQMMNADELTADHQQELSGEPLAPDILVNPVTLMPVDQ